MLHRPFGLYAFDEHFALGEPAPPPRLSELSSVVLWPCDDCSLFKYFWGVSECRVRCVPHVPILDANGFAHCRVLAQTPDLDPCPGDAGWFDPLGDDGQRMPLVSNDPVRRAARG